MDIKELDILENMPYEHWYYAAKSKVLIKYLSTFHFSTLFDVGSGSGIFTKKISLAFPSLTEAWCIDTNYEKNYTLVCNKTKINFTNSIPKILPDLYLFMDVLEHVEDDNSFLCDYVQAARNNAHFFFSVPAFPFLWSEHDIFLEHKRRYTLKGFEDLIRNSGLTICSSNFFFGAVFPIALLTRMANKFFKGEHKSQLKRHYKIVNDFLLKLSLSEIFFCKKNRLLGLSIICLAKKG